MPMTATSVQSLQLDGTTRNVNLKTTSAFGLHPTCTTFNPLFIGFALQDDDKFDDDDNMVYDAYTNEDVSLNDTDYKGSTAEPMLFDQKNQQTT